MSLSKDVNGKVLDWNDRVLYKGQVGEISEFLANNLVTVILKNGEEIDCKDNEVRKI